MNQLFPLGQLVSTPGALETFTAEELGQALDRHRSGDWGDCCPDDAAENDLSVKEGFRILSSYTFREKKLWIITEHDRSLSTALLPSEY